MTAVFAPLAPAVLPLIGFTSAGVAAVAAGSAFAIAQGVGAKGVCTSGGSKGGPGGARAPPQILPAPPPAPPDIVYAPLPLPLI